jgi:general secretion pathway protein H
MATSATGRSARPEIRRPGGFTLLEVLIVVLIIGIVLGLAFLSIREDPGQRVQTEVRRFAALVTLAAQEAVLQSRETAVELRRDGYRFLTLQNGEWVEPDDKVLRNRELPEDMELRVRIEGADTARGAGAQQDPRIYLLSGGEMTPFELIIRQRDRDVSHSLSGDAGGRLELGD